MTFHTFRAINGLLVLLCAMLMIVPGATAFAQGTIVNTATAQWLDHGKSASALSNTVEIPLTPLDVTLETLRYMPDGTTAMSVAAPSCGKRSLAIGGERNTLTLNGSLIPSDSFRIGELLYARIALAAANTSAQIIDTIDIKVTSTAGDAETMTIAETGPDTGIFIAAIPTSAIPPAPVVADCRLSVHEGDEITISLADNLVRLGSGPLSSARILADPYGLVFDSVDGTPVDGVTITMVDAATGAPATVFADDGITRWPSTVVTGASVTDASGAVYPMPTGEYRFPLAPLGTYRLIVTPPAPYTAPSKAPATSLVGILRPDNLPVELIDASYGGTITLASPLPVRVDIPVDSPTTPMVVTKTASRASANPGDAVFFTVIASNPDARRTLRTVTLQDTPSATLRFAPRSVRVNGSSVTDGLTFSADGRLMTLALGQLAPGESVKVTYAMTVRPDATAGDATNIARIGNERGEVASAMAAVRIDDEVLASRMTLIGRVTAGDCSVNPRLTGIPGVRVMLEDGSFAITDADGRYHFEGLVPGTHVVQAASETLPRGGRFVDCARSTRSAGSATSRFVTGQGGTLAVVDFAAVLAPAASQPDAAPAPSAAPAHAEPATDRVAAGAEIDWLAMGDGPTDFLFPAIDHNPRAPAIRVAIRHRKGEKVELSVDGKPVDSVAFDGATASPAGYAVSVWRGIPLGNETTVLTARVRDASGAVTASLSRNVHFAQTPARMELLADKSRLVADGSTRPVIALRVLDRSGRPVHSGITGEFTLNQPYESAAALDAMQARALSGLDRASPNWVVKGDDGVAYVELAPTMVSGPLRIDFAFQDDAVTRRQTVEAWIAPGEQKWTLVGLAEAGTDRNSIARQMQREGRFDSDLGDNARVALYAKGRVLGKFLLTASYDSAKQKDQQRLLGVIDPNAYYTVFADGSNRRFDAASREKLYVRIESRAFYAIYGDFVTGFDQTQLARYQRTMTGVIGEGAFGNVRVQGFAARTGDTHRRDEIQGGGISGPYRLSSRGVIANSEIVTIEVRDRLRSEVIVETKSLTRFIDYDIDLLAGTISFREPVLSRDADLNPRFIVVNYEVDTRAGGKVNGGVRATVAVADGRVRIGGTALTDTGANDGERADLAALDVRARVTETTEVRAEVGLSRTGGANSTAWLAEIEHHDGAIDVLGYVRSAQADFGLGQLNNAERGRRKVGVDGRYRFDDAFSVVASAWYDRNLADAANRKALEVNGIWRNRNTDARLGLATIEDQLADGAVARSTTIEAGSTRRLFDNRLEIDGAASLALGKAGSVDLPSRYRFGAAYSITQAIKLVGLYEIARGDAVKADTARVGFEIAPWEGARILSALGQQTITEYGKRSFAAFGLTQSLPLSRELTVEATLDSSTTLGGIDARQLNNINHPASSGGNLGDAGTIAEDFTAVTLGATWRRDRWSVTGRGELRDGQLNKRKGAIFGAIRQLGEGSMVGAGFTWTRATIETGATTQIFDAAISLASRPADSRVAMLAKVELRSDSVRDATAGAASATGSAFLVEGDVRSTRLIGSVSANWTPGTVIRDEYGEKAVVQRSELGLFAAIRHTFDQFDGFGLEGTTLIGGVDARLGLGERVEIGAIATVRHSLVSDTTSFAFGPQIGLSPAKNTMITIGYNITGYRDRDFSAARQTFSGLFAGIRLKFDADSLGFLGLRQ